MSWPLECTKCGKKWELVLPPLPVTLSAAVRFFNAQSKCIACDSPDVVIDLPEISAELSARTPPSPVVREETAGPSERRGRA